VEHIFPALTILAGNIVAVLALAIVKDVVNNLAWGETQLVLQKLTVFHHPARAETPHVEISGRRAGFIGYLLTLFDLSPKVTLTANSKEIRKSTSSLHGHSLDVVPLSESVSVQAESERSVFWLLAAIASLTGGVASGLLMGTGYAEKVLNGVAWIAASGIFLFAFYQSHRFQLVVHGTLRAGVSFKPSILEGRAIQFNEVLEAMEVVAERIQETRLMHAQQPMQAMPPSPYVPMGPAPTTYIPAPVPQGSESVPLSTKIIPPTVATPQIAPAAGPPKAAPISAFAPVPPAFDDVDETLNEMPFNKPPVNAPAAKAPEAPSRGNTGTVEYGDDPSTYDAEPAIWQGPEPGTSDSIQLRQSITRSATGMFLGVTGKISDMDDEEMDSSDSDHAVPTHRGTVSWEEHADKTQDEMRAEAELADLKRSRPKRGEAKFRLRDLMRRFPQTEAANKARRMLERLESGQ
jgi:hypothetical protein